MAASRPAFTNNVSYCAEDHPWDKDMDIEKYLQSTEEEMEEEEELKVTEEPAEEGAAISKSASKKYPHIGMQHCHSMAHACAHALFLLPLRIKVLCT